MVLINYFKLFQQILQNCILKYIHYTQLKINIQRSFLVYWKFTGRNSWLFSQLQNICIIRQAAFGLTVNFSTNQNIQIQLTNHICRTSFIPNSLGISVLAKEILHWRNNKGFHHAQKFLPVFMFGWDDWT